MKLRKRFSHFCTELGVGAYDVNLERADKQQKELPMWAAAPLALWHDIRLFVAARGIGAGYFDDHYDGYRDGHWNGG